MKTKEVGERWDQVFFKDAEWPGWSFTVGDDDGDVVPEFVVTVSVYLYGVLFKTLTKDNGLKVEGSKVTFDSLNDLFPRDSYWYRVDVKVPEFKLPKVLYYGDITIRPNGRV